MSNQTFIVAPVRHGKLDPSDSQKKVIANFLRNREGEHVRVTFSEPQKARSIAQNRYYWSVVVAELAADSGHPTEEVHDVLKTKFLPRVFVSIGGQTVEAVKSTTALDTMFFEQYLEQIRAFAATELQVVIPLPNES